MAEAVTGGCACGSIRYAAQGMVKFAIRCHCRACQRNTGSGHAVQAAVSRSGFSVEGEPAIWNRTSDAGHDVAKAFCPTCGCPLYGLPDRAPDLVMLMAASLDDPSRMDPARVVFGDTAQPWDRLPSEEN